MTTTLRVFVGEGWPEKPATRWVQIDAAGEVLQKGESDALRWPETDYCEAVITAPEVSWLRGTVPARASRRDLPHIVAGVIEDQLLDDPDRCHLTVCGRDGSTVEVLVISRIRLRNIVAQFGALDRPLVAAYSELQAVRADNAGWVVSLVADAAILARPSAAPLVLDSPDDGMPPELLATLAVDGQLPASITVRPEAGRKVDLATWQERLGTDVHLGAEYCWHALPADATNLLHGEFVSKEKRNNWWLIVKPAVLVATATLAVYLAVGLGQLGLSAYKVASTEARIAELFSAAFPGVPAVAPLAQTRRQLDQLRSAHGLARSDDVLVLLAGVADGLGTDGIDSLRKLTYANRQLTIVLAPDKARRVEDLKRSLGDRGFQVESKGGDQNSPSLIVRRDTTK